MVKSIYEGSGDLDVAGDVEEEEEQNATIATKANRKDKRNTRDTSKQTVKAREVAIRGKFVKVWARDEDFKACFLCRKEFNFFIRRKHHCRKCGQVFCSNCSNYFLSQLVNLDEEKLDKDTRLCQTCYLECKEFLEADLKNNSDDSDESDSYEEEQESARGPQQSRQIHRSEFREQFENRLRNLIRFVFSQEKKLSSVPQFSEQYVQSTLEFSLFCLRRLRLRVRRVNDDMLTRREKFHELDINRYVMIKTCLHKDANTFRYMNGIISSKNVAKKNMQLSFGLRREAATSSQLQPSSSTSLSNRQQLMMTQSALEQQASTIGVVPTAASSQEVRCLVIGVAVDIFSNQDSNYPDLQQVILKQRTYMQKIVEGIKMQRPQIIFCRENVNQDVLQTLENAMITVVQKVKPQIITKIAETARCQVIEDISLLLMPQVSANQATQQSQGGNGSSKQMNSLKHAYIGYLQSAYFKSFSFTTSHKTYMFLEQPEKSSAYHVSLLITGPQLEILKQFKKSLQVILRLAKHLYLEQEIVYMSNEMLKGSKKAKKLLLDSLESDIVDFGNLNNFLDEKLGLHDFLLSDLTKFSFVKIQYKKAEWSHFEDVSSKSEFDKYIQDKRINYDAMKVNAVVKFCGDFEHEQMSFYQVKDISLAEFLMNIINKRDTSCSTCQRPMYNHIQLYMRLKSYIRLSIVGRMDPNLAVSSQSGGAANSSNLTGNNNAVGNSNGNTSATNAQNHAPTTPTSAATSSPLNGNSSALRTPHRYHEHHHQHNTIFSPDNNHSDIDSTPKRKRINPKETVLTYILCEQCHTNLTTIQRVQIGKTFMEYSYHRFLQHLFGDSSDAYKREKISRLRDMRETKDFSNAAGLSMLSQTTQGIQNKCSHQIRSRVFNIKDVEIKFSVGRTLLYSFNKVNFTSEPVALTVRECDAIYYKEQYLHLKTQFKAVLLDATARFHKLLEVINSKKNTQKSQYFLAIQELYRNYLIRMEAEREYIIANTDHSKITNYSSLHLFYVFEQRIYIGLSRLVNMQKEVIKKKFKQFARQTVAAVDFRDEVATQQSHPELEISLLDEEFTDMPQQRYYIFIHQCSHKKYEILMNMNRIEVRNLKDMTEVLNVQEEKTKDDDLVQPFEYLPVYAKSHFSQITWALNSKAHVKSVKDAGLAKGPSNPRSVLLDFLRRQQTEGGSSDDKQIQEENRIVVRIMKCADFESLAKYESVFANSTTLDGVSSAYLSNLLPANQVVGISTTAQANHSSNTNLNQSNIHNNTQGSGNTSGDILHQVDQSDDSIESDLLVSQHFQQSKHHPTKLHSQSVAMAPAGLDQSIYIPLNVSANLDTLQSSNHHHQDNRNHANTTQHNAHHSHLHQNHHNNNHHSNHSHPHHSNPARQSMSALISTQQQQQSSAFMADLQGDYNFYKMTMMSRNTDVTQQLNSSQSILMSGNHHSQLPVLQSTLSTQASASSSSSAANASNQSLSNPAAGALNSGSSSEKICEIIILFAKQFEALRNLFGISLERIIESLRTCSVVRLPGGQTQSVFVKSHDDLFVVKGVSELEFNYFLSFAPHYFEYLSQHSATSLLAKVFGMFQVRVDGEDHYYSVMENLFFGIDKEACQSYDLKGSKLKRFTSQNNGIGLDTNLMIDQNCEPFFIDNSSFQAFDKTIRLDSDFLAMHEVVDYSLLLIVDKNKRTLRLGILDYFRIYDWKKQMENKFKELIKGDKPTIVRPQEYQERFVKTITKRFFCKL